MKVACADIDTQDPLTEPHEPQGVARDEIDGAEKVRRLARLNDEYVLALQRARGRRSSPPFAEDRLAVVAVRLDWSHHEGDDCLRLTGVDAFAVAADDLARRLPVSASAVVSTRMLPSLRGRYVLDGDAVCFVPRFPFVPGTEYTMLVCTAR